MQFSINRPSVLFFGATLLMLTACQPGDTPGSTSKISTKEESRYLEKSEALAGQLQKALGARLMAAMEEGGPVNGIDVCQKVAQEISESVANEDPGVSITRTALRVRNPLNAADPHSQSVLEQWQTQFDKGEKLEATLKTDGKTVIVHRPIMTAAICLQCHGEPSMISDETRSILQNLYPEDQATGFQEGDLRGAFRIEFTRK